jgi:hypothetical protein
MPRQTSVHCAMLRHSIGPSSRASCRLLAQRLRISVVAQGPTASNTLASRRTEPQACGSDAVVAQRHPHPKRHTSQCYLSLIQSLAQPDSSTLPAVAQDCLQVNDEVRPCGPRLVRVIAGVDHVHGGEPIIEQHVHPHSQSGHASIPQLQKPKLPPRDQGDRYRIGTYALPFFRPGRHDTASP